MQTSLKNIYLACGSNHTVFIQAGSLKLPFGLAQWQAKVLGGVAGKFIVGALVNNSLLADKSNSPWKKSISEDRLGLYHRLNECTASEASQHRAPKESANGLTQSELADINADMANLLDNRCKVR